MSTQRGRVLEIGIFHKELIGEDKFVASVTVPVADFIELPEGKLDLWVGCTYFYFVGYAHSCFPCQPSVLVVLFLMKAHSTLSTGGLAAHLPTV